MTNRFIAFSTAILCLSACAGGWDTPYQEAAWYKGRGGVSHSVDEDGLHTVKARGNGFTSNQTSVEHMYLRAAEAVIETGNSCFQVISQEEDAKYVAAGYASVPYPVNSLEFLIVESSDECEYDDANEIYERLAPKYKSD